MSFKMTAYRIFMASPGGLRDEREAFRATVYDYNETDAIQRGVLFIPTGWEDTLAGAGRPQGMINQDLKNCDYFVLVIWDRWGSLPDVPGAGRYTSGTEEEFHLAEQCLQDSNQPMLQMVIFFKGVPAERLIDPGEQLIKVLKFNKELEEGKRYFPVKFDNVSHFQSLLRRYLAQWIRDHEQKATKKSIVSKRRKPEATPALAPVNPSVEAKPVAAEPDRNPLLVRAERLADQGQLTEAETAFAQSIVNTHDADALNSYGNFLRRVGRLSKAREMYEQVISASNDSDPKWKSIAYGNLGQLYRTLGELDKSEEMHKKALEIDTRLGRKDGMAIQYGKLGRVYLRRDLLEDSEAMHRKARH